MKNVSVKLIYDESKTFAKRIKKIARKDPINFRRIQKTIDRLRLNPDKYDKALQGDSRCRFEKYIGRDLLRLVYTWCENCRKFNCVKINKCEGCGSKSANTLRLFDIYYKQDAGKLGY